MKRFILFFIAVLTSWMSFAQINGALIGVISQSGGSGGVNYSIANATYSNLLFDPSAQLGTSLEDAWAGGGYLFLYGNTQLYRYSLSDITDVSTATYDNQSTGNGQARSGLNLSQDGLNASMENFGSVHTKLSLSPAWDLNSAPGAPSTNLSSTAGSNTRGWTTNYDGTKLWGINSDSNIVYQFSMSPGFTGTPTSDTASIDLSANLGQGYGMGISPDGKYLLIGDNTGDTVKEFEFGTIGDVTTLTYTGNFVSLSGLDAAPYGCAYSEDGTAILVVGIQTDRVFQFNLNN